MLLQMTLCKLMRLALQYHTYTQLLNPNLVLRQPLVGNPVMDDLAQGARGHGDRGVGRLLVSGA